MSRIKLVVSDIDGTLLDSERRIRPRSREVVARLCRRGVPLVLCSARQACTILPIYEELGLSGPIIAHNGVLIADPTTGVTHFHEPLAPLLAQRILACVREETGVTNIGVHIGDERYVDRIDSWLAHWISAGYYPNPPQPVELEAVIGRADGVSMMYVRADDDRLQRLRERLDRACPGALSYAFYRGASRDGQLDVWPGGIDKGTALRTVASLLGVPLDAVLV
ncbi:MAG TPA: HAD family hydrolase, partial [Limnochordia bacterium]|nr:HAD family hydrolase [Limnochordia bacterium]